MKNFGTAFYCFLHGFLLSFFFLFFSFLLDLWTESLVIQYFSLKSFESYDR